MSFGAFTFFDHEISSASLTSFLEKYNQFDLAQILDRLFSLPGVEDLDTLNAYLELENESLNEFKRVYDSVAHNHYTADSIPDLDFESFVLILQSWFRIKTLVFEKTGLILTLRYIEAIESCYDTASEGLFISADNVLTYTQEALNAQEEGLLISDIRWTDYF